LASTSVGSRRISSSGVGSIRLLDLDGTAAKIETDADSRKPYGLSRHTLLANPNPIDHLIATIGEQEELAVSEGEAAAGRS
jgi:hypothetical protein